MNARNRGVFHAGTRLQPQAWENGRTMKRNRLGASALEVSEICLGTMTWGEQNSEAEGHAQIEWPRESRLEKVKDFGERYKRPRVLAAVSEYQKLAEKHRLPIAGIALAFATGRFFTASTIVGATSIGQLDELSKYSGLVLSPEVLSGIEEINTLYPSPCAQ